MFQNKTLSIAFAILVSFSANGFSQVKPVYIHTAEMRFSQGSYTVHQMFVSGTVIEIATRNGQAINVGSGKYKLDGNRFTIDWDNGGRERATFKITKTGMKYRITSHSDQEQVGMVLNYQYKKLDQENSKFIRDLGNKIAENRVSRMLSQMTKKLDQFNRNVARRNEKTSAYEREVFTRVLDMQLESAEKTFEILWGS